MYTLNSVEVHSVCYRKTAHPRERGGYQGWEETTVCDTLNVHDNTDTRTPVIVLVFDARGNGGGTVSPTITGDHQNRITDYTAIVVEHGTEDLDREEIL